MIYKIFTAINTENQYGILDEIRELPSCKAVIEHLENKYEKILKDIIDNITARAEESTKNVPASYTVAVTSLSFSAAYSRGSDFNIELDKPICVRKGLSFPAILSKYEDGNFYIAPNLQLYSHYDGKKEYIIKFTLNYKWTSPELLFMYMGNARNKGYGQWSPQREKEKSNHLSFLVGYDNFVDPDARDYDDDTNIETGMNSLFKAFLIECRKFIDEYEIRKTNQMNSWLEEIRPEEATSLFGDLF